MPEAVDPLALFSPAVAGWFRHAFGVPTRPQALGWPVIARGEHALILSPTGSGKTLTAFLWSLDVLFRELRDPEPAGADGEPDSTIQTAAAAPRRSAPTIQQRTSKIHDAPPPGVRVVYVSPLKALNNDIERNLQQPLAGIQAQARRIGESLPPLRVAVRTGDTPSNERQGMLRRPPHILITTPESLYLMLTAERARALFATTHTVIVDEIHTLVGTKRGAHLALSLERLERQTERRPQRIGLSATVRPLEIAARFLGGQDREAGFAPRPVTIVDAGHTKPLDLQVVTVTDDFRGLPGGTVWSAIVPEVTRLIDQHRTTLIFCNSRRLAERTADRLNERRLLERMAELTGQQGAGGPDEGRKTKDESRGPSAPSVLRPSSFVAPPPRRGGAIGADVGIFAAGVDASTLEAAGLQPIRAHHGSMSKAARLQMEGALKAGRLPALVATSSLELGIDIGEIDLVVHLQSPKSVAAGLQRVGRSGHLVGQTSAGRIFTTHVEDVLEAATVAHGMLRGEIESTHTPENPLDVLAQHVMAMVGTEDWAYDDLLAVVRGAYPFRNLGEAAFRAVLEMLSGKYTEQVSRHLQARLSWDRVNNRLAALPGARLLAIRSGGTIPDRGAYTLVLADRRTRVGELDEEFVFESRRGDTFLLGSQVWRIDEITDDRVVAEPAPGEIPRMPFWRGDFPWRPYDLGKRVGAFRRRLAGMVSGLAPAEVELIRELDTQEIEDITRGSPHRRPLRGPPALPLGEGTDSPPTRQGTNASPTREGPGSLSRWERAGVRAAVVKDLLTFLRCECALDRNSIVQLVDHVAGQLGAVGDLATDRTIVVELFDDAVGDPRMVVHSPFGGRINGPWAIVLAAAVRERLGVEAQISTGDDGIMLRFANADLDPSTEIAGVVAQVTSQEAKERLLAELPASPVFGAQFRMNAARALLLPRHGGGKRTPLWLSRLKAKDLLQAVQRFDDFPIVLETYRDCLRDVMDLDGLTEVLDQIQRGEIRVVVYEAEVPSPVAMGLDYRFAMQYVYEYDAPRGERHLAALSLNRGLLAELLQDGSLAELLKPEAVGEVAARVSRTAPGAHIRSVEELAQLLFEVGDLSEREIEARSAGGAYRSWLAELAAAGRIIEQPIGGEQRWIAAERRGEYALLGHDPAPVLRRWLAHAGPTSARDLAHRYGLAEPRVRECLQALGGEVVAGEFTRGGGEQWLDRRHLEQMHRRTLTLLRREVQPVPLYAYADFLRRWQHVEAPPYPPTPSPSQGRGGVPAHRGPPSFPSRLEGHGELRSTSGGGQFPSPLEGEGPGVRGRLTQILQQLRGLAVPGVAWERDVLPARLREFDLAALAERCQAGEVLWAAEGGRDPRRARVRFFFRGEGGLFLDRAPGDETLVALDAGARAVYDFLREEGAALLADIAEGADLDRASVRRALVELVLAGLVTNDTLAALHAVLGQEPAAEARSGGRSSLETQLAALLADRPRPTTRHGWRMARRRAREAAFARSAAPGPPSAGGARDGWIGRWSLVHRPGLLGKPLPEDELATRRARLLLARWGVVTKACLQRESPLLRWDTLYPVLSRLEVRGEVRRGYFVEGLPGVQFALPEVVEQLRAVNAERLAERPAADDGDAPPIVLSAVDPAQLFGTEDWGGGLRFARVASTAVAACRGEPVAVMEEGGASAAVVPGHPALIPALRALARWWAARAPLSLAHSGAHRLKVERWHGVPVLETDGVPLLEGAGFVREGSAMMWVGDLRGARPA